MTYILTMNALLLLAAAIPAFVLGFLCTSVWLDLTDDS